MSKASSECDSHEQSIIQVWQMCVTVPNLEASLGEQSQVSSGVKPLFTSEQTELFCLGE